MTSILQFLWSKKSLILGLRIIFAFFQKKLPLLEDFYVVKFRFIEVKKTWFYMVFNHFDLLPVQPTNLQSLQSLQKPSKPWNHVSNTGLFWYMAWNPLPNTLYYGHVSEKRLPTSNFQKKPSLCSGYVVINRGDPFDFNWSADADWRSVKNHKCYVVEHIFYTLATDADECHAQNQRLPIYALHSTCLFFCPRKASVDEILKSVRRCLIRQELWKNHYIRNFPKSVCRRAST